MDLEERRKEEHAKYARAYEAENYHMGDRRKKDAINDLRSLPARGFYLDVACGKGEMLEEAKRLGFELVNGTEIVPELIDGETVIYSEVHALQLPQKFFDVVTMFDVIEHLIPGDDELACRELVRVAKKHILLTANNRPSFNHAGDDLHVNKRPYDEWDKLFRKWFPGKVIRIKGHRNYVSECWRVDL